MIKGSTFIISGPSGCGKDTILQAAFKKFPDIFFSISSITRIMREGEKQGEKYNFISVEEFEKMINEDKLLEYNSYLGNYYGTPKGPVETAINSGRNVFIEVDVNGAAQIRKKMPEAISIFIMPPSLKELKRRLILRGTETAEKIEKRMAEAPLEIGRANEFDYIVINDDPIKASAEFISIIESAALKTEKQKYIIDEVLKNVEP